jgi:hypothetical protein
MNNRLLPYHVQSGIVTQLLTELTQKHPELLKEIKERLAPLPEPVSEFIFRELKYRSYPYDLKELTKPWATNPKPTHDAAQTIRARRRLIQRRPR